MTQASGGHGGERPITVALLGNPNTGKSTLFSTLAGIPTRIGNYPGVTVEEKVGRFVHGGRVIDLVPRTKVVTGATPLRRTVIEQVAPPQIRTRNLTPTPILAASAGQPRATTVRQQPPRTTVWWKRLAASDESKD